MTVSFFDAVTGKRLEETIYMLDAIPQVGVLVRLEGGAFREVTKVQHDIRVAGVAIFRETRQFVSVHLASPPPEAAREPSEE